jgi:DNA-binding NarL/FixJ family response regulator
MSTVRGEVLLAEDEAPLREQHGRGLRQAGFSVLGVGTGKEAAQAFSARKFDVLLADIDMPGNSKLELLSFIRDEAFSVPVVLMTHEPTVESLIDALRHGVVDYITKPLDLVLLAPRLDEAIQKGRTLRALADVKRLAAAFAESVSTLEATLCKAGQGSPASPNRLPAETAVDPLAHMAHEVERLSPRELEVARLLALGKAVQDVASALDLSPNTVRNHIKSVFAKLRVHSQVELLSKLAGHR